MDKFVSYLSLEEHKGKDAFDNDRYYVFKVRSYIAAYVVIGIQMYVNTYIATYYSYTYIVT